MKKEEVNWENTFRFEFRTRIGEKSHITPFMVEHKMFPGTVVEAWTDMDKCHGWSGGRSLKIHVRVIDNSVYHSMPPEVFEMTQGQFCKVMSNVYNDSISKKYEIASE